LEIAVHHLLTGQPDVAQQVVVKAEQKRARDRTGPGPAQALEGILNERKG
jgi:hypothetical protein